MQGFRYLSNKIFLHVNRQICHHYSNRVSTAQVIVEMTGSFLVMETWRIKFCQKIIENLGNFANLEHFETPSELAIVAIGGGHS